MTVVVPLPLYRNKNNIWLPWNYLTADEKKIEEEKMNKFKETFKIGFGVDRDERENDQKVELKDYLDKVKKIAILDRKEENKLWNKIVKSGGDKNLEDIIFKSKLNDIFLIVQKYYNSQYFFTNLELIRIGEDELLKQMDQYKKQSIENKNYRDKYREYPKYYRHLLWNKSKFLFNTISDIERKIVSEIGSKEGDILEKEYYSKERKYYKDLSEEERQKLEKFFGVSREELERKLFIIVSTHSPHR